MTIEPYTPERLAVTATLWPESKGRAENEDHVVLDMVAIPKSGKYKTGKLDPPTYRRGWGYLLPKEARFSIIPFTAEDHGRSLPAVGIVLREPNEEIFVAWFRAEREAEARFIVNELNAEVAEVWRAWEGSKQGLENPDQHRARWLTFERGHEFAPDSRWGAQTLTLYENGRYAYARRQRGRLLESKDGSIATERATVIFAELQQSTFPNVPEHKFPPGATVLRLGVGEGAVISAPVAHTSIERDFGLGLPHYAEVIEWLLELTDAIRTDDQTVLDVWRSTP